jgi:hypothetical protein
VAGGRLRRTLRTLNSTMHPPKPHRRNCPRF